MLLIALALDLTALIGLCLWRPEPEPKPKPVCLMSPAELWDLFAGLDADGSGDLDGAELGALLKALGAVAFTHPLGFLLLVLAASIGVYLGVVAAAPRGPRSSRPPASRPTRAPAPGWPTTGMTSHFAASPFS